MTAGLRLWHRFFLRGALSVQIFLWIFVFGYFFLTSGNGSLEAATVSLALTYALTQVVTILLSPFSARGLRFGYRDRIILAVFALIVAYLSFALLQLEAGIVLFAISMGIYRAYYWAPYRVAVQAIPANNPLWTEYVLALFPVVIGFAIAWGGYSSVVVVISAAAFALFSLIPLFLAQDSFEGYAWGYRETFHQLFVPMHRRATLGSIMQGMEMSLLLVVWPIIVFIILGWSFALLGIVMSLTYVLSILLRSVTHRPMLHLSAPTRALYAASAWVMRLSVSGSIGIILIDTYYHGGSKPSSRGSDMLTLEHAADNTTYIDEYTVLKEVSMALGRLSMSLLVAFLASNMSVTYTFAIVFLVGALAAASGVLLSTKHSRI